MEVRVNYIGFADRQAKIASNEAQGLRMTHDNFDMVWLQAKAVELNATESYVIGQINKKKIEPQGTMTFTDVPEPTIPPPEPLPTPPSVLTGSYTGNDTEGRQITTGFKCSRVTINSVPADDERGWELLPGATLIHNIALYHHNNLSNNVYLHASDGFVVGDGLFNNANRSGVAYYFWAISE